LNQDIIICPACQRRTPAARAICLYCGAALSVREIHTAPPQKNLESYERAFNTVLAPALSNINEESLLRFAEAMDMEISEAQAFLTEKKSLPVARSQTQSEAELIAGLIRNYGFAASVIPDNDMRLDSPLIKARKVILNHDELLVLHSSGELPLRIPEIKVMVLGLLKNTRTDFAETASALKSKAGAVLDTAEFRSEEVLLDIYTGSLAKSFRIKADSFDYSGLITNLAYRIEVNFQAAIFALQQAMPEAMLDTDFARLRRLLGRAWPERSHTEARGIRRSSGFKRVAEVSVISTNRDQFERYSRLVFLTHTAAQ